MSIVPPKVSVVIPVFNRPEAIRRAIQSVLGQTCQDFEIIVVDDGSTDGTPAAVASFKDPRIAAIRHEKNRGGSAARNTGVRAGSAEYVAFLDSDDEWLPTKLERQLEVFRRSDRGLALVYSGTERILADGNVVRHIPRDSRDLGRKLLIENVVGGTSVPMVRRYVLDEIGGFDEALPAAQDVDLWLRISERFSLACIPDVLVRIVQQKDRTRISENLDAVIRGRELFCGKHKQKLISRGVLHLFLRESGWVHHRSVGDLRIARRCYREAIVANPLAPISYLMLLAAYVPTSWLDHVARCKHFVTELLCSKRLAPFTDSSLVSHAARSSPTEAMGSRIHDP